MWDQTVTYEQPLNELMRVCLRLEHLFKQVKQTLAGEKKWHAKLALRIFADCLAVVDRPDLKPRLIKEFNRYLETLHRWQVSPSIDTVRLSGLIEQAENALGLLQQSQGKLTGHELDEDFISSIRQNIALPAGDCSFSMPRLHYWLHHTPENRIQDLQRFWSGFKLLRDVIDFMMQVIRATTDYKTHDACDGLFQASLSPNLPSQLCSVQLPSTLTVYPEISVGRHGINIRFMHADAMACPQQTREAVPFKLSVCII